MTDFDAALYQTPLLGVVAYSGTGKTTLIEGLLPLLVQKGLRVAVIKHAHHQFDVDTAGKDSYRFRQAGAAPTIVASQHRFAVMMETPGQHDLNLSVLIEYALLSAPDMILIEGFKSWPLPKLELHRPVLGHPLHARADGWIRAVASNEDIELPPDVERLPLDDLEVLSRWVSAWPARWENMRHSPRSCGDLNADTST
ncbi:molybdopterin-guanine dinucleotide biosynthesis protein B [Azomonas macrocytogenes]|uniref:Molybdopterin-guanine dinucleotide biosynthesis protein B n=1 Tax=Azomonas macrocytogenes TaxID=69962 RepID=A0A839T0B6_AZOMA|nr:molybdopterin-guanine dinucleotide biosynthesis protein B [Azomonas macrocytogenes]MBB3101956.1 molybdopterin-guanine dinucleotide biosynthesis protein B [Azomonas macrocytogenes]